MADMLSDLAPVSPRIVLPILQFLYWSLAYLDHGQGQQQVNQLDQLGKFNDLTYVYILMHITLYNEVSCYQVANAQMLCILKTHTKNKETRTPMRLGISNFACSSL